MNIENKIEATELILALVARLNVIQARLREGKPHLRQEQIKQSLALRVLLDRAKQARSLLLDEQPKYRYLKPGETVQPGDEIVRYSPFADHEWRPVMKTIGSTVQGYNQFDFRRPV